jgi:hypothetical protein
VPELIGIERAGCVLGDGVDLDLEVPAKITGSTCPAIG